MRYAQQRSLERALVDLLLKTLRPAMQEMVERFRLELTTILAAHGDTPAAASPHGQLGRPKCCGVCKLKNARNHAALPSGHTQEDHRRWKRGGDVAVPRLSRRGGRSLAPVRSSAIMP